MGKNLTQSQKEELNELFLKNIDAFQPDKESMGRTKLATHSIPTGNATPIETKQYQIPSIAKQSLNNQVDEMDLRTY